MHRFMLSVWAILMAASLACAQPRGVNVIGTHNHSSLSVSGSSVSFDATGGVNNENLTLDLETTSNTVEFSSTTSVDTLDLTDFAVKANTLESSASATDGGTVTFCEDSDVGTDCVKLSVGQTDLPGGTSTITFDSNGRIPDSAVGNGTDDVGITLSVVGFGWLCNDNNTTDGTTYMYHFDGNTSCSGTELNDSNDRRNIVRLPYAGAINSMTCEVFTAPGAGQTVTFTARFEGSDTDCIVTISDTATGPSSDTTCSTAYTATNYISISHVTSVGAADVDHSACFIVMEQTLP